MTDREWDVIVVGAGPAGLAAAAAAKKSGVRVCILEREERPGGILKQCIHPGFGLIRFGEELTGPEYADRFVREVEDLGIHLYLSTFLTSVTETKKGFELHLSNSSLGLFSLRGKTVVFATGCRERTARQIFLHGTRPAGVLTAGLAQYFINIQGYLPLRRCIILGSGDIGLIMARRLTLEGAEVEGVYEILPEPSGLTRNIAQCLEDFSIPLHLQTTVIDIHGERRVQGVTLARVDNERKPIAGTERFVPCDGVILSVGLIPENELLDHLDIVMDPRTGGPKVDQKGETSKPGIFSCGNSLMVNDLVDYVSESGEAAGRAAAEYAAISPSDTQGKEGTASSPDLEVLPGKNLHFLVPQRISPVPAGKVFYFRSERSMDKAVLTLRLDGEILFSRKFRYIKPPEMERIEADLSSLSRLLSGKKREKTPELRADLEETL